MNKLDLFFRLAKFDAAKGEFHAVMADETPDNAKEIFDYAKSKPHFEKWSQDFEKATDGKSLGNVRAMHGKVAAGKLTKIEFDDAAKQIRVVGKVVDENEKKKMAEGIYTGVSIGGKYGSTWADAEKADFTRYEAIPSEVSIVDKPCNPNARFTMVKADGAEEERVFKSEDDQPAETDQVWLAKDGTTHHKKADCVARNVAIRLEKALKGPADLAKKIADELDKKEGKTKKPSEMVKLEKGLYDVSRAACILADLEWLHDNIEAEAYWEGDDSEAPANLREILDTLGEFLVALVEEEVMELKEEEAEKLDLPSLEKIEKYSEVVKATYAKKKKKKEEDDKAGAKDDKGDDAAKVDGGDLTKITAERDSLQKALNELTPTLEKLLDRVQKLEQQPQPPKGAVRVVEKREDSELSGAAGELQKQLDYGSVSPENARAGLMGLLADARKKAS